MLPKTLMFASIVSLLALIMIATLPKPDVILSVSARTQSFEYRVFNKESSAILLSNAKLVTLPGDIFDDESKVQCVSGEITFNANTDIKFWRGTINSPEAMTIRIQKSTSPSAGELIDLNGQSIPLNNNDTLVLDPTDETCTSAIPARLPIWGDGAIGSLRTIGSSNNQQNGDLIEGQVRISARAVEKIFKVIKGAEGLYEAGVVSLPLGTRLESDSFNPQSESDGAGRWVGQARPISTDGIPSFQVDFSTDDQRVWLHRPGVRAQGKPDPIGASAFVSQTKDPGIIRAQVFIAAIFLILQTVSSLVQTIEVKPRRLIPVKWLARFKRSSARKIVEAKDVE